MTETRAPRAADRLDAKLRREILVGRYLANPLVRGMFKVGLTPPMHTLLETRGRKTGLVRRVPVAYHVDGSEAWVISQHGRRSGWAANIGADPRVRILHRGRWLEGTAQLLPDDDVRARIRTFARSAAVARVLIAAFAALETRPCSVKITLVS